MIPMETLDKETALLNDTGNFRPVLKMGVCGYFTKQTTNTFLNGIGWYDLLSH